MGLVRFQLWAPLRETNNSSAPESRLQPLSSVEASLCCRETGEKEKESAEERWEGEREKKGFRLFPLPIIRRALSIFTNIAIFIGIPSGSLCGGELESINHPFYARPAVCPRLKNQAVRGET